MVDFEKIIWREGLTLVDFFAAWCGPCQAMHPILDRFQRQMNGRIDLYKIDIDNRAMEDAIRRYAIASVPTLIFFRHGKVLWRRSGLVSYEELVATLNELEREHYTPNR